MLLYVRHGATLLNKGGKEERLRGWLPVDLNEQGIADAHKAGRQVAKSVVDPVSFTTSDLPRAMQTAHIIGQYIGKVPTPDPRLRDWNTGKLAGQKVTDVMPLLRHLIKNPDESAPGGEPLNAYLARFVPAMREKVGTPGMDLVVGHARGATILEGIASPVGGKGGDIDPKYLLERPQVQPGGLLIVNPKWDLNIHNVDKINGPDA